MATSTLYNSSQLNSPSTGIPTSFRGTPCQESLQPKADWHATFTDTNRVKKTSFPSHQSLQLRQHDRNWLPSYTKNTPLRSLNLPTNVKEATETRGPSYINNVKPLQKVKCLVCMQEVTEPGLHNHLLFGPVRCDLCATVCGKCLVFRNHNKDVEQGRSTCEHMFSYCKDPYDYVLSLFNDSDFTDATRSQLLPENLSKLQQYINKLTRIQLREPWSTAIRMCKSRLIKATIANLSKECHNRGVNFEDNSTNGENIEHRSQVYSLTKVQKSPLAPVKEKRPPTPVKEKSPPTPVKEKSPPTPVKEKNPATPVKEKSPPTPMKEKSPPTPVKEKNPATPVKENADNLDDGVLLTQSYDLEHLDQAVEYVEVEGQCRIEEKSKHSQSSSSNKQRRRKINHYKKLKTQRLTHQSKRKKMSTNNSYEHVDKEESELVKVEMPEDGYYLIVRRGLEDCPMCYAPLNPNLCTVNLRTFLFTVRCPECGLVIYMVPNVVDGLQIVTEDDISDDGATPTKEVCCSNETTPSKQTSSYKEKRINPRSFFAK